MTVKRRPLRIYSVTEGEMWWMCLLGWLAIPILLTVKRETTFEETQ